MKAFKLPGIRQKKKKKNRAGNNASLTGATLLQFMSCLFMRTQIHGFQLTQRQGEEKKTNEKESITMLISDWLYRDVQKHLITGLLAKHEC